MVCGTRWYGLAGLRHYTQSLEFRRVDETQCLRSGHTECPSSYAYKPYILCIPFCTVPLLCTSHYDEVGQSIAPFLSCVLFYTTSIEISFLLFK